LELRLWKRGTRTAVVVVFPWSKAERKANKNEELRPLDQSRDPILKVLVTYYSDTGNTEKIAKAIYEEASKKHQAQLKKVKEVKPEDLSNYDLVFLGGPCHANDLATPIKRLLTAIPKSPRFKLAGFFTHMSPVSEKHSGYDRCIASLETMRRDREIDFKGYYDCQGVPSLQVQELVKKGMNVPDDEWEKSMKEARKHPGPEDIQRGKEFARQVLARI
jgi:flavodoxin